jgi:plasmid stability protein
MGVRGTLSRLCDCDTVAHMRNVTISLPDDVYRQARIKAAERDTSVSALVREYLVALGQETSDFERRKQLQKRTLGGIARFRAGDRLTRDRLHDRDAVR